MIVNYQHQGPITCKLSPVSPSPSLSSCSSPGSEAKGGKTRNACKGWVNSPKLRRCAFLGCGKSFSKSDHLKTHVRTHTGERPFKCDHLDCNKVFADSANLKRHKRVHTGEKPFRCCVAGCEKRFSVSSNLKQHLRIHTGEKPFVCQVCDKKFSHISSKRKHSKKHCSGAKVCRVTTKSMQATADVMNISTEPQPYLLQSPQKDCYLSKQDTDLNFVDSLDPHDLHCFLKGSLQEPPIYLSAISRDNFYHTQLGEIRRVHSTGLHISLAMEIAFKVAAVAVFVLFNPTR